MYSALVEEWGAETLLFMRELPGCFASAPTVAEAVAGADATVARYLGWATALGLTVPGDGTVAVAVAEHIAPHPGEDGILFTADREAPTQGHIDLALRVGALLCAELIGLYQGASHERRARTLAPGTDQLHQAIPAQLRHIAALDLAYIAPLSAPAGVAPDGALPADPAEALTASNRQVEAVVRGVPAEARARVFTEDGELWTVAKVLRRRTGHLSEHYPSISALAHSSHGPVNAGRAAAQSDERAQRHA